MVGVRVPLGSHVLSKEHCPQVHGHFKCMVFIRFHVICHYTHLPGGKTEVRKRGGSEQLNPPILTQILSLRVQVLAILSPSLTPSPTLQQSQAIKNNRGI